MLGSYEAMKRAVKSPPSIGGRLAIHRLIVRIPKEIGPFLEISQNRPTEMGPSMTMAKREIQHREALS
jgi:hypothetical protein